jgi:hypothetical protein
MAKFSTVHVASGMMSGAEYEGDFIKQDKQFVQVYKFNKEGVAELVAAIHLDKGTAVVKSGD